MIAPSHSHKSNNVKPQPSGGYLPIFRSFFEHELWAEPRVFSQAEAWLDLLQGARWHDHPREVSLKGAVVRIGYAQLVRSTRSLAASWRWPQARVKRYLNRLTRCHMIDTESVRVATRITICNYGKYDIKRLTTDSRPTHDRLNKEPATGPKRIKKQNSKPKDLSLSIDRGESCSLLPAAIAELPELSRLTTRQWEEVTKRHSKALRFSDGKAIAAVVSAIRTAGEIHAPAAFISTVLQRFESDPTNAELLRRRARDWSDCVREYVDFVNFLRECRQGSTHRANGAIDWQAAKHRQTDRVRGQYGPRFVARAKAAALRHEAREEAVA